MNQIPAEPRPLPEHGLIPEAVEAGFRPHTVSAVYPSRQEAEGVRLLLLEQGVAVTDIQLFHQSKSRAAEEGSDEVLQDVLLDAGIGTAVGTGIGALGELVIAASSLTLFVASPVIAPLAMLGWFAGIGGIIGAAVGAGRKDGRFSELIRDAIHAGNTVLLVRTHDEADREKVRRIVEASFRGRDEISSET